MKTLLIVESPNKAKQIRGYFPDFTVIATVGHFKDLPPKSMGVEPPDHKPEWVVVDGKQQIVSQLCSAAKVADIIYIATDPDREGEAIAAHVANTLGKQAAPKVSRITYSEVSKSAIQTAIQHKRGINWPLVRAQEARRVVDRYVGYLVSSELTKKFKPLGVTSYLTAGRVQSVALKLVVERHDDIAKFVSVKHYGLNVVLQKADIEFIAQWRPILKAGELLTDINKANEVKNRTQVLKVLEVKTQPKLIKPPKPLITSSFVRLMAAALKLTTKDAMSAAQTLFERGLITYHRTDSPVMSQDFASTLRDFAVRHKLPLPKTTREFKAKANAQEGHECLRVTDINVTNARAAGIDDGLLQAVYQLVWKITLESQLADAVEEETIVTFANDHKDSFVSRAKVPKELGWRKASIQFTANDDAKAATEGLNLDEENHTDEIQQKNLPELAINETLKPVRLDVITKNTEPPEPYTEKTLVEKLDKLGIGRPSTYASTMERIVSLSYVTRAKNLRFDPTPKGISVSRTLDNQFSFMNYGYTAEIESAFDKIAMRQAEFVSVVHEAWSSLTEEITAFKIAPLPENVISFTDAPKTKAPSTKAASPSKSKAGSATPKKSAVSAIKGAPGDKCPRCKEGTLSAKKIQNGPNIGRAFVGCSKFPTCTQFSWMQ